MKKELTLSPYVLLSKRGVSSVVSIVLLVLLTIFLVSILAIYVFGDIKDRLSLSDVCYSSDISFSNSGYNCYDSSQNVTLLDIKKGSSDANVSGLKFYLFEDGNSRYYYTKNNIERNQQKVFYLNTSFVVKRVYVVPILKVGVVEKECAKVSLNYLGACSAGSLYGISLINESSA